MCWGEGSVVLVHCCYYISLLPGWWNIVQNGDPLYAAEDYKQDCGGHIWPNRVQFFCKKHIAHISVAQKKLFGPKKIIFGALGRHLVQSHGAFWGVFKNWGFNPQFLKAFSGAEASDLSIRWLQASTGTFQKMRIESSILENSPKSPMGWDYHPFFGGKNPKKSGQIFFTSLWYI